MNIVAVTEYPNNNRYKNTKLKCLLDVVMRIDTAVVRYSIYPGEYSSIVSARNSIQNSIKRFRYPIRATIYKGELYLIREDKVIDVRT